MKLLGKLCSKSPKDPFLRGRLITIKKQYKKLIRYKKISWQRNILRKLEEIELKDPKEYWNIIDKLKGETDNTFITNPKKFECFFKDLFSNKIK